MDNLTKINLDNYKPLRDVVFENLREAILEGKLKPGQRLIGGSITITTRG